MVERILEESPLDADSGVYIFETIYVYLSLFPCLLLTMEYVLECTYA